MAKIRRWYCLDCEGYVSNYAEHSADHTFTEEILYDETEIKNRDKQIKELLELIEENDVLLESMQHCKTILEADVKETREENKKALKEAEKDD